MLRELRWEMKIMNGEKKHIEGEKDLEKEGCSISCKDWIMLLNYEIDHQERSNNWDGFTQTSILLTVIFFTLIGWMITGGSINRIPSVLHCTYIVALLLAISILYGIYILLRYHLKTKKRVKALEYLREKIIIGNVTDSNKIRTRWEKINKT